MYVDYIGSVEIEFDARKDSANLLKHGVSLAFGSKLFDDADHIVIASIRPVDGEDRYKVIGTVDGRLWTAIHVCAAGSCVLSR